MLRTYRAILRGDRVEWGDDAPVPMPPERAIPVHITLLEEAGGEGELADPAVRGQRMAEVLEQLAAINAFAHIDDPVAWQREIRRDRPLPGRPS
jgi:hypothetical protein